MAFYKVRITETYSYDAVIDADDIDDLNDVLHDEVPLLIDMGEAGIDRIKEQGNGLHLEFDYDSYELDEDEVDKEKETCVDLTSDSTFFD